MLALWDFHDFHHLLENRNLSMQRNRDVHCVLVNEMHMRNLNSLLNVLNGRHLFLQMTT